MRNNAAFGQGTGPIFLNNVMCTGFETSLFDCPHSGFELNGCSHSADAGVTCIAGISDYEDNSIGLSLKRNSIAV